VSVAKLLGEALVGAWRAGVGPGDGRFVIDIDSFVGEVCGRLTQDTADGYTKLLGYDPILATRADTREVLHIRLPKGSANRRRDSSRPLAVLDRGCASSRRFRTAVEAIDEGAWRRSNTRRGRGADRRNRPSRQAAGRRRARLELWSDWRHFAFITDGSDDTTLVEAEHRDHAVVEQVIADLRDQAPRTSALAS
jgi:hypothetical protein